MTMTPEQARAAGLEPLAGPYEAHELPMLDQAVKTLGAIRCAVVTEPDGLNLWRDKRGMKLHNAGGE